MPGQHLQERDLTTQNNSEVDRLILLGHLRNRLAISYHFALLPHRDASSIFSSCYDMFQRGKNLDLSQCSAVVCRFSVSMQHHQKSIKNLLRYVGILTHTKQRAVKLFCALKNRDCRRARITTAHPKNVCLQVVFPGNCALALEDSG